MPRTSPFAHLADGPASDAVTVEVGRPKARALGCFGLTAVFLAILAAAAFSYAAGAVVGSAHRPPGSLRAVAVVLGIVFGVIVVGLVVVSVKAVRGRQGLAFDPHGVWWRDGTKLVTLPWTDVAAAALDRPVKVRGQRSSVPLGPALEVYPTSVDTLRDYLPLVDKVTSGEPAQPGLPTLRFTFRLPDADTAERVADAVARWAPAQWASGQPSGREEAPE